jgi:hypothetical protein
MCWLLVLSQSTLRVYSGIIRVPLIVCTRIFRKSFNFIESPIAGS